MSRTLGLPEDEARIVQKSYWRDYGTTLNGMMANHTVDMREFLDFVHDVDPTGIITHPELAARIESLPGKRLVYTNGSLSHAENILGHMGLTHLFDDIFDVEASGFQPKPHQAGFDKFVSHFDLPVRQSIFFEDSVRNLKTAHDMGFTTVLVRAKEGPRDEESAAPDEHPDHVHHAVDCLPTFLGSIRTAATPDDAS